MRPIIRWSLWERRWSVFFWSLGTSIYAAMIILVYGTIRGQTQALNQAIQGMPDSVRALFSDSSDLLSPVGYLSSKLYYLILPLLFTALAISLCHSLIAREEQDGTLELLLARPVSRGRLWLAKLGSSLLLMLAVGAVTLGVTVLCAVTSDFGLSVLNLALVTLVALLLSVLFGAVAWLLFGLGRFGKRASIGGAAFVALGSYLVTSLEGIANWLETPAKFLPYHYYQPSAILHGTYNWWNAAGMALAAVILFGLGYLAFRRRDLG